MNFNWRYLHATKDFELYRSLRCGCHAKHAELRSVHRYRSRSSVRGHSHFFYRLKSFSAHCRTIADVLVAPSTRPIKLLVFLLLNFQIKFRPFGRLDSSGSYVTRTVRHSTVSKSIKHRVCGTTFFRTNENHFASREPRSTSFAATCGRFLFARPILVHTPSRVPPVVIFYSTGRVKIKILKKFGSTTGVDISRQTHTWIYTQFLRRRWQTKQKRFNWCTKCDTRSTWIATNFPGTRTTYEEIMSVFSKMFFKTVREEYGIAHCLDRKQQQQHGNKTILKYLKNLLFTHGCRRE